MAHAQVTLDHPHEVLGKGVALVVEGRYAEAEKPLREALRLDPTLAEAHYNLGVALREQGRFDDAIAEYRASLAGFTSEPDRSKALYGMDLAREAHGDKNAWEDYLAFALPLRAEQPTVQIAKEHRDILAGVKVPGSYQKATR
ncbi:MAG: tetratricopeptide repeat protein [Polyangia bacterium]